MDDAVKKQILGSLLKKERSKQGLTQDALSSLVGIDVRNLSNIERGKNFPSFKTFCKIVEILKIEPNYFLNFIQFNKTEKNPIDVELFEILGTYSDEIKGKILELVKTIK